MNDERGNPRVALGRPSEPSQLLDLRLDRSPAGPASVVVGAEVPLLAGVGDRDHLEHPAFQPRGQVPRPLFEDAEDQHEAQAEEDRPGEHGQQPRPRAQQHADGGWGWFIQDDSDPLVTSYAVIGLAEARIFPAINVAASGTRKEERLYSPEDSRRIALLRRTLADRSSKEAMVTMLKLLEKHATNEDLLRSMSVGR